MADWALAVTSAHAEHLAAAELTRLDFKHYLFKRRSTRVHRGKILVTTSPAFPRYLMVPIDYCWQIVREVSRIIGLVHFGEQLARVRDCDLKKLIDRCNGGDVLPAEAVREPYAKGERVHVGGTGIIGGHTATYERVTEDGKLRLNFEMLGKVVPVDVDRRDVFTIAKRRKRRRSHKVLRGDHGDLLTRCEAKTDQCKGALIGTRNNASAMVPIANDARGAQVV